MDNTGSQTYAGSGVNYRAIDPFKLIAQESACKTAGNIQRIAGGAFKEFEPSRGESAYLIETVYSYIAHVVEGLGTKNLVADAMYVLCGKSYYDHIAQCTVAMIVNDLITLGALPLSVGMHLAVGSSGLLTNDDLVHDLVGGWKHACDLARCVWGGGETPMLKDIVIPGTAVLSGSAIGVVTPKERLMSAEKIMPGDAIVFLESSGIHANGLTLARKIAESLPEGYMTKLSDGRTYGETLLDPTHIYVGVVEDCFTVGVRIHYAVNITGHGWRKLMRAPQPLAYVIEQLPTQQPIFEFMQKHGSVDDREAYGNLNMGAGFALFVSESDVSAVLSVASTLGLRALYAGHVKESDSKKVVIQPKGLEYSGDTLKIR